MECQDILTPGYTKSNPILASKSSRQKKKKKKDLQNPLRDEGQGNPTAVLNQRMSWLIAKDVRGSLSVLIETLN